MNEPFYHLPVLGPELAALVGQRHRVVDGTLGDGGHASHFLGQGASVLGFDRDPAAIQRATARLGSARLDARLGSAYASESLAAITAFRPDLILLDLGVSSRQLDDEGLGFSFRPGVRLDMRMSGEGATAADLLNAEAATELTRIFREFGDEPRGARLAAEIVRRRATAPFRTSDDLVNAIRGALGPKTGPSDFARIFQAIRIAVNGELDGLSEALPVLEEALAPAGALAVMSYHSGEDRIVKNAFRQWGAACVCPPSIPRCTCRGRPLGRVVTRKPVVASETEAGLNPRARSVRLRVFVKADEPPQG